MIEGLSGHTAALIDAGALAMLLAGGLFVIRWLNKRLETAEGEIKEMHHEIRTLIGKKE